MSSALPLLLVTHARAGVAVGGRQQLAWLHREALAALLGHRLLVHELVPAAMSRRMALQGHIDGLTPAVIGHIVDRIRDGGVRQVFLDGSNLGLLAAAVKRALPQTEVLTFCHNVEARFFWGSLKAQPSLHAAGVLAANYRAERLALRWSDRVIALSGRDGTLLKRLYGRGATDLLPMALHGSSPATPTSSPPTRPSYALFVGGAFYANLLGAQWFGRAVAPRSTLPVVVIGRGMEMVKPELERIPGMRVVGGVEDLTPWYRNATIVIAPIFDGSGMKTKVAEALMFGKHVIGTPEAFSGYADDVVRSNRCCTDAASFVAALADAAANPPPPFDPAMSALFERDHSFAATCKRLTTILRGGHASDA